MKQMKAKIGMTSSLFVGIFGGYWIKILNTKEIDTLNEEYDEHGRAMIWQANNLFWGAPICSHVTDMAMLDFFEKNGASRCVHAPRAHVWPVGKDVATVLTHADETTSLYIATTPRTS